MHLSSSLSLIMYQILSVTDMHTVPMPCYTDKYPFNLLYDYQVPVTGISLWHIYVISKDLPAQFKQNSHIFIHLLMPHVLTVTLNRY
jgi:hypothetical protein